MGDADRNEIELSFGGLLNLLFGIMEPLAFGHKGQLDEIMGMKRKLVSLRGTVNIEPQVLFEEEFAFQCMVYRIHPSTPFSAKQKSFLRR
ncbi:hypothetical protein D3C75_1031150 [compost metagenome]